jgi:MoaA/NifB/PqqE/SkfB family radical SAM enzyme
MLKELSIEIIRKCPSYCVHCSSLSDANCAEMLEYDKFVAVATDAAKLGANTICFSGGEPFLHPRIIDMIEFANMLGLKTYVYTSGIVFDAQNNYTSLSEEVLQTISGIVTKLIFNIEAATSDTYDLIMGTKGCFDIMKQSIISANKFSIIIEAHFVPMKLNIAEIEPAIALCKELQVAKLSFLRLVLHGRALQNEQQIALSDGEFKTAKALLEKIQTSADISIRLGVPLSTDVSCHKCEAANGKLNIKYDGKVFPCEVFKNGSIAVYLRGLQPESIYSCSLKDIYSKSQYLQLVREMSREFASGGHCETCIGQYLISKSRGDSNGK